MCWWGADSSHVVMTSCLSCTPRFTYASPISHGRDVGVFRVLVHSHGLIYWHLFLRVSFTLAFAADLAVQVATGYRLGTVQQVTMLPLTAVLRPLKLISREANMRAAVKNFVVTLFKARQVGSVVACVVWLLLHCLP